MGEPILPDHNGFCNLFDTLGDNHEANSEELH